MSLKEVLKTYISRRKGEVVNFEEMETICKLEGRRVSNMERGMRELMEERDKDKNPIIVAVRSKKKAIIGYKWFTKPTQMRLI